MRKLLCLLVCLFVPVTGWGNFGSETGCFSVSSCSAGYFLLTDSDGCDVCCKPTILSNSLWQKMTTGGTNKYRRAVGCKKAVMNADNTCSCTEYTYEYACEGTYYWDGSKCVLCPSVRDEFGTDYPGRTECSMANTTDIIRCLYPVSDSVKGIDKCYLAGPTDDSSSVLYTDDSGTFEIMADCYNN